MRSGVGSHHALGSLGLQELLLLLSLIHILLYFIQNSIFISVDLTATAPPHAALPSLTCKYILDGSFIQEQLLYRLLLRMEEGYEQDECPRRYIKIVLVGESGVGKSNIISRYIENKFSVGVNSTIGLEFSEKHVKINTDDIVLQIWDTAGQERFRALNKTFYNNSLGALVIFDLAERQSFDMLGRWMAEIREHLSETAVLLLLGNKCDIKDQKVSVTEAFQFAKREGMGFLETSAALGTNVREAFELLTRKIVEQVMEVKEFQMKTVKQKPTKIQPRKQMSRSQKQKKENCCK